MSRKVNKKQCDKCGEYFHPGAIWRHKKYCGNIKRIKIITIEENWKQENGKYKCPFCEKEYCSKGICTHIWKNHTEEGKKQNPNIGYKEGRIVWNKGLTKETNEIVKKYSETLTHIPSSKKGKKFEEIYGEERAALMKKTITERQLKKYQNVEERKYLRDIGKKGGYGKKGYTNKGTYYASNFEKQCFEYLENNNILFEAHKYIPNSSKVSDIYLIEKDLWIELDGINREKKKEWLGKDYDYWLNKLKIYKEQNLSYKIIYKLEELKNIILPV
jgi:hypothetical protein